MSELTTKEQTDIAYTDRLRDAIKAPGTTKEQFGQLLSEAPEGFDFANPRVGKFSFQDMAFFAKKHGKEEFHDMLVDKGAKRADVARPEMPKAMHNGHELAPGAKVLPRVKIDIPEATASQESEGPVVKRVPRAEHGNKREPIKIPGITLKPDEPAAVTAHEKKDAAGHEPVKPLSEPKQPKEEFQLKPAVPRSGQPHKREVIKIPGISPSEPLEPVQQQSEEFKVKPAVPVPNRQNMRKTVTVQGLKPEKESAELTPELQRAKDAAANLPNPEMFASLQQNKTPELKHNPALADNPKLITEREVPVENPGPSRFA